MTASIRKLLPLIFLTLIVGGDELARGEVTVRDMRAGEQRAVARADAVAAAKAVIES